MPRGKKGPIEQMMKAEEHKPAAVEGCEGFIEVLPADEDKEHTAFSEEELIRRMIRPDFDPPHPCLRELTYLVAIIDRHTELLKVAEEALKLIAGNHVMYPARIAGEALSQIKGESK